MGGGLKSRSHNNTLTPRLPQATSMYKFAGIGPKSGATVAMTIAHGLPPEEGWTACLHHVDPWRDDVVKQRQKATDPFFRRGANVMEFRISVPCLAGFSGITPKRGDELFFSRSSHN